MIITPVNGYILVEPLEEEKNKLQLPPEILSQNKERSHGCVLVRLKEDFRYYGPDYRPWEAGSILVIDVVGLETFKYEQKQYSIVNVKYVKGVINDEHSEE